MGAPLAALWVALLQFLALKRIHRVPTGILLLAYLLPAAAILLLGVGVLLVVMAIVAPDILGIGALDTSP